MNYLEMKDPYIEKLKLDNALENRTIYIYEEINNDECFKISYYIDRIVEMDEQDGIAEPEPIILKINSGGGVIYHSMHVIGRIDYLQDFKNYKFHAKIDGICASAALDIALTCKHVSCLSTSTLMYHSGSGSAWGTPNNLEIDYKEIRRLWDLGCKLALKHTKVTQAWLDNVYNTNSDFWLSPSQALELGFVDEVIGTLHL